MPNHNHREAFMRYAVIKEIKRIKEREGVVLQVEYSDHTCMEYREWEVGQQKFASLITAHDEMRELPRGAEEWRLCLLSFT